MKARHYGFWIYLGSATISFLLDLDAIAMAAVILATFQNFSNQIIDAIEKQKEPTP